ncbi:MAG: hypothetical protein AAF442_00125 [Pseudomonadota bacterium]
MFIDTYGTLVISDIDDAELAAITIKQTTQKWDGDIAVERCGLNTWPPGIQAKGDLYIIGCQNLTHIPADLNVSGKLVIADCESLGYDSQGDAA